LNLRLQMFFVASKFINNTFFTGHDLFLQHVVFESADLELLAFFVNN
jgi:hypothetical protein